MSLHCLKLTHTTVPTVISLLSDVQTLGFSRHLPVSGSGPINTTWKVCVALTVG